MNGLSNRTKATRKILSVSKEDIFEEAEIDGVSYVFSSVTATDAKINLASCLDEIKRRSVVITKGGLASAVMMTPSEFIELVAFRNAYLDIMMKEDEKSKQTTRKQ